MGTFLPAESLIKIEIGIIVKRLQNTLTDGNSDNNNRDAEDGITRVQSDSDINKGNEEQNDN